MTENPKLQKSRKQDTCCALCGRVLTDATASREHIFPNAIGGRRIVKNFICVDCNSSTGTKWDSELVTQFRQLCTLLDINRGRGRNRGFPIETLGGRQLVMRSDGSMTIAKPVVKQRKLNDRTEISIQARSISEFKDIVTGLKKKYPQIDVEEMLQRATSVRDYSEDPLEMSLDLGGDIAGLSVIKTCLACAYDAGLSIDDCEHARNYLLGSGETCFGYFNEVDLVKNRPQNAVVHCVHLFGDPETRHLFAYVEYFGVVRIVACLSSNYDGPGVCQGYAIDPVAGNELDLEVDLRIAPKDLPDIYSRKRLDYEVLRRSMDTAMRIWSRRDVEGAIESAIEDAWTFACSECGVQVGDPVSDEKAARIARLFSNRLAPFLHHLIIGRRFSDEDLKEIRRRMR